MSGHGERLGDGLSDDFVRESRSQLEALRERQSSLADLLRDKRAELNRVESEADRCSRLIAELESLLGFAPQMDLQFESRELRGKRIREVAVEVLREEIGEGKPVSYGRWFDLLVAAGYRVVAKNPRAAFLTQISRAPGVERIGNRSGLYQLVASP